MHDFPRTGLHREGSCDDVKAASAEPPSREELMRREQLILAAQRSAWLSWAVVGAVFAGGLAAILSVLS